jgi:hypothetical protein
MTSAEQMDKFVKKLVSILAEDFGISPPEAVYINTDCKIEEETVYGIYDTNSKTIKYLQKGTHARFYMNSVITCKISCSEEST